MKVACVVYYAFLGVLRYLNKACVFFFVQNILIKKDKTVLITSISILLMEPDLMMMLIMMMMMIIIIIIIIIITMIIIIINIKARQTIMSQLNEFLKKVLLRKQGLSNKRKHNN